MEKVCLKGMRRGVGRESRVGKQTLGTSLLLLRTEGAESNFPKVEPRYHGPPLSPSKPCSMLAQNTQLHMPGDQKHQ